MNPKKTEQETTSGGRIYWPSPQDYCEAVQTPRLSFEDSELCNGTVKSSPLGLPICMSGNFASVFCFDCGGKKVAVRCFLHNVPDQHQRYSSISKFVLSDDLECTVPFEYLEKGIKVHGDWYPILKMEWVDGVTLNQFVEDHVDNSMALNLLAGYFKDMVIDLQKAGIAHGDLQHDNILLADDSLRLVDYDGLFVPALGGCHANELGHPNYQHPLRSKEDFAPYLDNFSGWVIYLSLRILSLHPDLLQQVQGGGDCLLLRQTDFQKPNQSIAFQLLEHHTDERVRNYAQILRYFLHVPFADIPPLNTPINQLLTAAKQVAEQRKVVHINQAQGKRVNSADCLASVDLGSSSGLPDWMHDSPSRPAANNNVREFEQPSPPPLQALAQAIAVNSSPSAQSLYANSPLYVPSQSSAGANLHSPLLQPSAVPSAQTQLPDLLYPEFLRIELPFDSAARFQDPKDVEHFITPQLEPGETVVWHTYEQAAKGGLSKTSIFLILVFVNLLFGSILFSPAIFSIAVAALVLMYMCGFYQVPRKEEQVLTLVTDRRLIYVTRKPLAIPYISNKGVSTSSRFVARSLPLSAVAGISFTEPNRLTFVAVNDFRLAYFKYVSKLNIVASRIDAEVLMQMQPHLTVKASRAPSHLVNSANPHSATVGSVLSVFGQASAPTSFAVKPRRSVRAGNSGSAPPPLAASLNKGSAQPVHPIQVGASSSHSSSYTASGRLANAQNPHLHYPGSTPHPVKTSLLTQAAPGATQPDETVSIDEVAKLLGLTASSTLSHAPSGANGKLTSPSQLHSGPTAVASAAGATSTLGLPGPVVVSSAGSTKPVQGSPVITLEDPNDPDKGAYITIKEAAQILGKKRGAP